MVPLLRKNTDVNRAERTIQLSSINMESLINNTNTSFCFELFVVSLFAGGMIALASFILGMRKFCNSFQVLICIVNMVVLATIPLWGGWQCTVLTWWLLYRYAEDFMISSFCINFSHVAYHTTSLCMGLFFRRPLPPLPTFVHGNLAHRQELFCLMDLCWLLCLKTAYHCLFSNPLLVLVRFLFSCSVSFFVLIVYSPAFILFMFNSLLCPWFLLFGCQYYAWCSLNRSRRVFGGAGDKKQVPKPRKGTNNNKKGNVRTVKTTTRTYDDRTSTAELDKAFVERFNARTVDNRSYPFGTPVVVSHSDPTFRYGSKDSGFKTVRDFCYQLIDGETLYEIEHGNNTCLFDVLFAFYLGTQPPCKNEDSFYERLESFNTACKDMSLAQARIDNTIATYVRQETLCCSDWAISICQKLNMRVLMLSSYVVSGASEGNGETVLTVTEYGSPFTAMMGCRYESGIAGMFCYVSGEENVGGDHFALVDDIRLRSDADLKSEVGCYTLETLLYSFHRKGRSLYHFKLYENFKHERLKLPPYVDRPSLTIALDLLKVRKPGVKRLEKPKLDKEGKKERIRAAKEILSPTVSRAADAVEVDPPLKMEAASEIVPDAGTGWVEGPRLDSDPPIESPETSSSTDEDADLSAAFDGLDSLWTDIISEERVIPSSGNIQEEEKVPLLTAVYSVVREDLSVPDVTVVDDPKVKTVGEAAPLVKKIEAKPVADETDEKVYGYCRWNERYVEQALDDVIPDANVIVKFLMIMFGTRLASVMWSSKLLRRWSFIKKADAVFFRELRSKIQLIQNLGKIPESREILLAYARTLRMDNGQDVLVFNPHFMDDFVTANRNAQIIYDSFEWVEVGEKKAEDVYDYSIAVEQLHETLNVFAGNRVEWVEHDLSTPQGLATLLRIVNEKIRGTKFPTLVPAPDGKGERVWGNRRVHSFNDLEGWEQLMFLSVFQTSYRAVNAKFFFDMEAVIQLTSPKILVGSKTYNDVDNRIETAAASTLSKFSYDFNLNEYGDMLWQNNVMAAKCIGKAYMEKMYSKQDMLELNEQVSGCFRKGKEGLRDIKIKVFGGSSRYFVKQCRNIYGYRTTEIAKMSRPGKVVRNFTLSGQKPKFSRINGREIPHKESDTVGRKLVGITNYDCFGALSPIPDTNDRDSIREGMIKRIGSACPEPEPFVKAILPGFVEVFIHKYNLDGAIVDLLAHEVQEILNWDTYVETLRYSPARMKQIKQIKEEVDVLDTFDFLDNAEGKLMHYLWCKVEAHVKWESYHGEKKFLRMIFARMDHFKVFFGPFAKLTQKALYRKLPFWVTDKPVCDLAAHINDWLGMFNVFGCTDFSQFESHNFPWLMNNVFIPIVHAIYSSDMNEELLVGLEIVCSRNIVENKFQNCKIDAKTMSGEVWTTIINTLTNVVLIMFFLECEGLVWGTGFIVTHYKDFAFFREHGFVPKPGMEFRMCAAGDDGVFGLMWVEGLDLSKFNNEYMKKYGINIKIEVRQTLAGSGFLSKYFSEIDLKTLCDPLKHLSKGVLPVKYANSKISLKKALARAKAMSLLYEFGNCPIVSSYARCIIRCTEGIHMDQALSNLWVDDYYKFELIEKSVKWYDENKSDPDRFKVGADSRLVIEDQFSIPYVTQVIIEDYFDNMTTFDYPVTFVVPCLDLVIPQENRDFYFDYTTERPSSGDWKELNESTLYYYVEREIFRPEYIESTWFDLSNKYTVYFSVSPHSVSGEVVARVEPV